MQAGKLRHRVIIQKHDQSQDPATGEIVTAWVNVATVWAAIEPLSAREFIAAQAGQSQISARATIRYTDGLDATMRLLHNGAAYNIEGVLPDPKSGRHYLTLTLSGGVSDGR